MSVQAVERRFLLKGAAWVDDFPHNSSHFMIFFVVNHFYQIRLFLIYYPIVSILSIVQLFFIRMSGSFDVITRSIYLSTYSACPLLISSCPTIGFGRENVLMGHGHVMALPLLCSENDFS